MDKKSKKNGNSYLKYTSIAFQMFLIIGLFSFAGYKLDEYQQMDKPIYTALFGILGVAAATYQIIRQLNKL